ncbi:MAG: hypothetical protein K2O04_02500 [Clostridiales bacterium]|nr:hypothetical protein [Clostridiales bacterium]
MKKKFLVIMTAVIMALVCAFGLVACGSDGVEGTYYVYMNGEKQEGMSMKLDDGKITTTQTMAGQTVTISGTYEVDGKTVKITVSVGGVSSTQDLTIVSDGILKDSNGLYYCVDGKTPPADEEAAD